MSTLAVLMDVFYQEMKQLGDSSGTEGQRLEAVFSSLFL